MEDVSLRTNSLKLVFGKSSQEPSDPEIFDFMSKKMKLKPGNLLSMYKDRMEAAVIIKFKTEIDFKDALASLPSEMEFTYNKYQSTKVRLSPASAIVRYVRLFNLPPEVQDQEIQTVLSKYGKVQRMIREKYGDDTGFPIWTSVRGAYLELKEGVEIPATVYVRNIRTRVFYEGLVNKCFLCGGMDHLKAQCPKRKSVNARMESSRGLSFSEAVAGSSALWTKQTTVSSRMETVVTPEISNNQMETRTAVETSSEKSLEQSTSGQRSNSSNSNKEDADKDSVKENNGNEWTVKSKQKRGRPKKSATEETPNTSSTSDPEVPHRPKRFLKPAGISAAQSEMNRNRNRSRSMSRREVTKPQHNDEETDLSGTFIADQLDSS